jgi:cell division protein FtsB
MKRDAKPMKVSAKKTTVERVRLWTRLKERVYGWRRKAATVGVGALALMMAYGVVFGHNGITMFLHKQQEERSLRKQMQQLQADNERLQGHVDRLQNDPGAIEHQAREELHYTRSTEVIVTLSPTNSSAATAPQK